MQQNTQCTNILIVYSEFWKLKWESQILTCIKNTDYSIKHFFFPFHKISPWVELAAFEMMGLGSQMQLHLGPAYHGIWCICSTFTLLQQFPLNTLTSTLLLMVLCLNGTCTSSIHHYFVVWCLILNPIQTIFPFSSL